ncbi:MAG: PQQ-binding-like beta-propeller repeat protein [Nocardioidaceae bacterium]
MRGRRGAAWAAVAVLALAAAGCTTTSEAEPQEPATSESPESTEPTESSESPDESDEPRLTLDDVGIGGGAQANREGIMICGDRIVAAPPSAGIENDAFAVFDRTSGEGELTHVELPEDSDLEINARWLLVMRCIDADEGTGPDPILSFAYQEMPLPESGGVGVRGAYTLDGQQLWIRDDLNQPAELVDGLLVVGAAPEQPDVVVDGGTGRTLRTFESPLATQLVLTHNRMVVRGAAGGSILTDIPGKRITKLSSPGSVFADGGLIFGVNFPNVTAFSSWSGTQLWDYSVRLDPLGEPRVEEAQGVAVFVDHEYVAHGVDAKTGEELWEFPTEVENPRLTVGGGLVLLDRRDAGYQALIDSRTGQPLPEQEQTIIDLTEAGALQIIDGRPAITMPAQLRTPPPTPTD